MNQPNLTTEQELSIRAFETQVRQMSREQAQEFLVKLYIQMIIRDAVYRDLIKYKFGLVLIVLAIALAMAFVR